MFFLPELLAGITGVKRYKPTIRWSKKSWTHNVFRFYELVFWRRVGMRQEVISDLITGKEWGVSFEGKCAVFESRVRRLIRSFATFRIAVRPVLLSTGFSQFPIGYSFAIALDATSTTGAAGASPQTVSHTCTGSNLILVFNILSAGVFVDNSNGATYNSVSATKRSTQNDTGSTIGGACAIWTLQNPSTGANTVSITSSTGNLWGRMVSLSGANDFDAQGANKLTSQTSVSPAITTIADNCWLSSLMVDGGGTPSIGSGYNIIGATNNGGLAGYAGPFTPAGAQSPQLATFTSGDVVYCVVSISPFVAAGGTTRDARNLTLLGVG